MRRAFVVAVSLAASLSLSGCWPQRGFDAGRSYWNPFEKELTSGRVHQVTTVWDTVVGTQEPEPGAITGLVADVHGVYATAAGGVVARLDHDSGAVAWRRVLDPGETSPPPGLALPTLFDDWLFVRWGCCRIGIGGHFWVDRDDGSTDGGPDMAIASGQITDVAVAGGSVATTGTDNGFVYELIWGSRRIAVDASVVPEPAVPGNRFAIIGDRIMWTYGDEAVSFGPECRPSSDPQLNCEPEWRVDLGVSFGETAAVGARSVAFTGPMGIGGSGILAVLDAATGAVRWRTGPGHRVGPSELVVARRTIVVGSLGRLAAFRAGGCGEAVCEPVWQSPTGAIAGGEMVAANDVLYAVTPSGDVAAYDVDGCGVATCEPLATIDAGARVGPLIVHAGQLIVGTEDGHVVALALPHHRG